ncbi:hypothetical protein Scep_003183 [Stephania cephalantha]|uniref:E3 ubiquitin protein ligase n=1 Tax=Stephania cephalantha TaxID=152367 RepID=A0AAP0PW40_9MAGN
MENADGVGGEEPEKKRRLLNSDSSAMARSSPASPDQRTVDEAVLQYQNQKLVQQLEAHKHELHDLEDKFKELREKQNSYDEKLIVVNRLWNQLVDDLILFRVQAGGSCDGALELLDQIDSSRGSIPSCPSEKILLFRLLESGSLESNGNSESIECVEEALRTRHSSTLDLMKSLQDTIDTHRAKIKGLALLPGNFSAEDAIIQQHKIDELMEEEASNLQKGIDILQSKHKQYSDVIQLLIHSQSTDQSEIKRISGELEESMAELEESRRKLVNLNMQINGSSGVHIPLRNAANGSASPEKHADKSMGLKELKISIEEARTVADSQLSELQEAQEDNAILSKQLLDLQSELKDDKFVTTSKPYTILSDQLQHWNSELERYKGLMDSMEADRTYVLQREKELNIKAEAADAARTAIRDSEAQIEELELQLRKLIVDRNDLEAKVEEVVQDSGRKDIKTEFQVMASALSKEMDMMKIQLNRYEETAREAFSLREEVHSLKNQLSIKMDEQKSLADKCSEQMKDIKSLKSLIEKMRKETQELQIFVEMHGQGCLDTRDITEIKESEHRARAQAEVLSNALDEHSLELRVKAANEAESACQQRLFAAESEIADLRAKLDASERDVLELTEAIKIKDMEADAYISEIETIGQAYEDMQTQNQHLLQQVADRDDYNIKIVSESVKAKQVHNVLMSEKQAIAKQLQQVKESQESLRLKIAHSEDQIKSLLTEAAKASQENRHLALSIDNAKWELTDAEKELKWLKSAIASSEKELEQNQRKMSELQQDLEIERTEKARLKEELDEMNSVIDQLNSETGEAAIQRLQDEVKDCKAILKCGVCFDRPKEVVITKCFHLFCNQCIQRNLEIRHRKCPGCGTAFGHHDVRFVNI